MSQNFSYFSENMQNFSLIQSGLFFPDSKCMHLFNQECYQADIGQFLSKSYTVYRTLDSTYPDIPNSNKSKPLITKPTGTAKNYN